MAGKARADDKPGEKKKVSPALNFTLKNIDEKDVFLGDYQGDVLLMVNVASKCGYTPQYRDLEALYRKYKDQGFKVPWPRRNNSSTPTGSSNNSGVAPTGLAFARAPS